MEKILSPDERIKRAEEIYYSRKMQAKNITIPRVDNSYRKEFRLVKKMLLQIVICALIYIIFYMIQNNNYIFSQDVIKKTNEILSYNINTESLYNKIKEYFSVFINTDNNLENVEGNNAINEYEIEQKEENIENILNTSKSENNLINNQIAKQENIGGENIEIAEEEKQNLTQMEVDAKSILETKSLIIPLKGTITSRYGPRNPTTKTVPKYHTGIDIAVNEGTAFIASMEGTVETVSSVGDYGNHVKIINGDVMTLYAHCKTIYVKKGDKVNQGQKIGEVGATGNVTGPHLHFEIRKENRYVDPDLILKF